MYIDRCHCRINSYQHSFFPSVVNLWNQLPSDTVGAASLNLFQNRLASLTLRKTIILDHVLSALHHALFLPVFTNVFYFYTNFISSTPLLRIFYLWSKQKRIRTVRQYSGSLAHPRGMYYNGKEGRKEMGTQCRAGGYFKLDTGAYVTVISQSEYRRSASPCLNASTKKLVQTITCCKHWSSSMAGCRWVERSSMKTSAISGPRRSLLSRRACMRCSVSCKS